MLTIIAQKCIHFVQLVQQVIFGCPIYIHLGKKLKDETGENKTICKETCHEEYIGNTNDREYNTKRYNV